MSWNRKWLFRAVTVVVVCSAGLVPVGGRAMAPHAQAAGRMPQSDVSAAPPGRATDLVFLHHSIGAQLLAEPGAEDAHAARHPNGGGLRKLLEADGYRVHEATYGSALGEHTDFVNWLPKFRDHMTDILQTADQDQRLAAPGANRVVMFKSCYPNNYLEGQGVEPGNPVDPVRTVANAKAALRSLLPLFGTHPETLFVYLTVPPIAAPVAKEPLAIWMAKKILGKPGRAQKLSGQANLARELNDWSVSPDGWLAGYAQRNVAVFDLYGTLTEDAGSNFLAYPSADGNSHPSSAGNRKVAGLLAPFVNRALRRAGLTEDSVAAPDAKR